MAIACGAAMDRNGQVKWWELQNSVKFPGHKAGQIHFALISLIQRLAGKNQEIAFSFSLPRIADLKGFESTKPNFSKHFRPREFFLIHF